MNNAGLMRIGAMLAVLTVLAGTFATLPYWTASAANKTVWGFVDECGTQQQSYLRNVIVNLTDAHSGKTLTNSTPLPDRRSLYPGLPCGRCRPLRR